MAEKLRVWFDPAGDFLEVRFSDAPGFMRETANDALMERVDESGRVVGFSILGAAVLAGSGRLKELLTDRTIRRAAPRSERIKLYGDGERSALNLALERQLLLLIDDWRPYEAAQAAGVEVVSSIAYFVGLYQQRRITFERAIQGLARMTRRGTLRPEWIHAAVRLVAEIRGKGDHR